MAAPSGSLTRRAVVGEILVLAAMAILFVLSV
jgi:hypothetical protein